MGLSTVSTFKTLQNENNKLKKMNDGQLKSLQKVLLEIIDDIDFVCEKYDITYNLGGGSALGAIRHNGFIPWDDDLDINMPRKDYKKFCEFFIKEFSKKYWLHTPEKTKDYGLAFARIRKKGTVFRSREDLYNTDEAGVYIDLFIIENIYDSVILRYLQGFLSMAFGFLLSCRNFYRNKHFYMDMVKNNRKLRLKFRMKIIIGFFISWISVDKMTHIWNNVNSMCKNDNSKYVSVPVGRNHFFGEIYERNKFCKTIKHIFEGESRKLPICIDYDGYLTHMYGDYMKIPKKENRETHIFLEFKL